MGCFQESGNAIMWQEEGEILLAEAYGKECIRVRASRSLHISDERWNILPADDLQAIVEKSGSSMKLTSGDLTVLVESDGTVSFLKADGSLLFTEDWEDKRNNMSVLRRARCYKTISSSVFSIDLYLRSSADEDFYGLGGVPDGKLSRKGEEIELVHKNGLCPIPYVISSKGYGFIWNTPAAGRVAFSEKRTHWHADAAEQIDIFVFTGNSPDAINKKLIELTGNPSHMPDWALGFWQSRLRYERQEDVLAIAARYKEQNIPVSAIVIDYFHWPVQGTWEFDRKYWPDPEKMVADLRALGIEPIVSIWPTVDPRSPYFREMRDRNMLLKAENGLPFFFQIMGVESIVDPTHPDARDYWWDVVRKNYVSSGITSFWLDETEPEMRPYEYGNMRMYIGNGLECSNIYAYYYTKTFHDGQIRDGLDNTVNLVRSAWLGSQTTGIILWSGDIPSSFDSLYRQIRVGLNASLSGIPYWTTDIGGFFGGNPADEGFRELLVRWFEFAVFSPVLRLHGKRLPYDKVDKQCDFDSFLPSCGENEIWSFGEEVYGILRKQIELREILRPYIRKIADEAEKEGRPMMRPLFYDYPGDENLKDYSDAYLFGSDIIVSPVTEDGKRECDVYLPEGTEWISIPDMTLFEGGRKYNVSAPLERIPFFLRKNSPSSWLIDEIGGWNE